MTQQPVPEATPTPEAAPEATPATLTHVQADGSAHMVDVSAKDVSAREATAAGRVYASAAAIEAVQQQSLKKGDALAVARIAGIQAAKRTPELIPLCHPIAIHGVKVEVEVNAAEGCFEIRARTRTADRTGVEMEALTCVAAAGLTMIDMIKAVDPAARLTDVHVIEKLGGKTGHWHV